MSESLRDKYRQMRFERVRAQPNVQFDPRLRQLSADDSKPDLSSRLQQNRYAEQGGQRKLAALQMVLKEQGITMAPEAQRNIVTLGKQDIFQVPIAHFAPHMPDDTMPSPGSRLQESPTMQASLNRLVAAEESFYERQGGQPELADPRPANLANDMVNPRDTQQLIREANELSERADTGSGDAT